MHLTQALISIAIKKSIRESENKNVHRKDTLRKKVSRVYKNRLIRTLKPIDSFILNLSVLSHSFVQTKICANSVSIQSNNIRPDFIMYAFVSVGLSE